MPQLKIRYNTEHNGGPLKWRAISMPGWNERLFKSINAENSVEWWTTEDQLPDGRIKHHITMNYNELVETADGSLFIK